MSSSSENELFDTGDPVKKPRKTYMSKNDRAVWECIKTDGLGANSDTLEKRLGYKYSHGEIQTAVGRLWRARLIDKKTIGLTTHYWPVGEAPNV